MNGSRNFKAFSGTLAGVAIALTGVAGTQAWAIFNDDAANTYTFSLRGQSLSVLPGECVVVPVEGDSATLDGTGDYRAIAFDNVEVVPYALRARGDSVVPSSVGTAAIAALAVTEAKIAAGAVTETKIGSAAVTEAKIADAAVTDSKRKPAKATALAAAGDAVTGLIVGNSASFATKHTIGANKLKVGSVIRIRASGKLVTKPAGSAQTEQIGVSIGGIVIGSATPALNGALNDTFTVDAEVVVRAIGAAGKFCGFAYVKFGHVGAQQSAYDVEVDGLINTTAGLDVTIDCTFAADATAGDVVDLVHLTVEVLDSTT